MQALQTSLIIWDFLYCALKQYVLYIKHTGDNFFHIFLVWFLSVPPRLHLREYKHSVRQQERGREGSSIPILIFKI